MPSFCSIREESPKIFREKDFWTSLPNWILSWLKALVVTGAVFGGILLLPYLIRIRYVPQVTLDTVGSVSLLLPLGAAGFLVLGLMLYILVAVPTIALPSMPMDKFEDQKSRIGLLIGLGLVILFSMGIWWAEFGLILHFPHLGRGKWALARLPIAPTLLPALGLYLLKPKFLEAFAEPKERLKLYLSYSLTSFSCGMTTLLFISPLGSRELVSPVRMIPLIMLSAGVGALGPSYRLFRWSANYWRIPVIAGLGLVVVFLVGASDRVVAITAIGNREVVLRQKSGQSVPWFDQSQNKEKPGQGVRVHLLLNIGPKLYVETEAGKIDDRHRFEVDRKDVEIEFLSENQTDSVQSPAGATK